MRLIAGRGLLVVRETRARWHLIAHICMQNQDNVGNEVEGGKREIIFIRKTDERTKKSLRDRER